MAFHVSKRKLRPKEPEELGEMNLVPYLDILMNLIIFMLMSITGLAAFGVLNVSAPNYGGAAANNPDNADKPQQLLTVLITPKGFFIAGSGAVVGNVNADPNAASGQGEPTIPKAGDAYDFAKLTQLMISVKQHEDFRAQSKIIIGADATIPYETLIQTMDAVRETPDRKILFSDVTLGAM